MPPPRHAKLSSYNEARLAEMEARAASFRQELQRRRTVRAISDRLVPRSFIEECLMAAGAAPSGANMQPWRFVVASNPGVRHQIRLRAEQEEREFYQHRASPEWLAALEPLGTEEDKPFLEVAPYIIVIFARSHGVLSDGRIVKIYYVTESVGIVTGILITALHQVGLVTLTHTPSPIEFLNDVIGRPANERPFLILVAGYPAAGAVVPQITKRSPSEIATFI
jgi:iodotyrosine deiodinase